MAAAVKLREDVSAAKFRELARRSRDAAQSRRLLSLAAVAEGCSRAEAAMLGQPITMLIPHVIGFKLTGTLKEGTTATDLVLTVTEMLRKKGVVGKFVEFFGDGLSQLPLADRATLGNMSPEFGSTCAIFPCAALPPTGSPRATRTASCGSSTATPRRLLAVQSGRPRR